MYETTMEQNSADLVQNVANQAGEFIEDCLSNSIILRKILEHFPDADLLQLSFVNKFWNYEARSLMKKRGNLVACVTRGPSRNNSPFENLQAFGRDLLEMNVAPFSGIKINLWRRERNCASSQTTAPDPTHEAIINELTLKQFSLQLSGGWWKHEDTHNTRTSPALLLTKRILHHFSPVLEKLSLRSEPRKEAFIQEVLQHSSFPRLKILNLHNELRPSADDSFYNSIKALVSSAPNLQEFHNNGDINLITKLLSGSSAVFMYPYRVDAPFHQIWETGIAALRLEDIRLEYNSPNFNFERFNRITPILLQVCCTTTLRNVTVDAPLAVTLISYGVTLKNVNRLNLLIDYRRLELEEPRVLIILKDFDFTRIFPSLDNVTIDRHYSCNVLRGHLSTIIEEANAFLTEPLPDRAHNIKQLDILYTLSDANVQSFADMFPNIHKLAVINDYEEIPIGCIWKHWKSLEELQVEGNVAEDLDSIFCGIFQEEIDELKKKDEGYLRRVNIVPVMPAFTCMINLRSFTCRSEDPEWLFSKVTELIAFARCPTIAIHLSQCSEDAYDDFGSDDSCY